MAAHALLGASGSKRWMACTPSARLETTVKLPEIESRHAAEGTVAHDLFEQVLGYALGQIDDGTYEQETARIKDLCATKDYDYEIMLLHCQTCSTFVRNYVLPGDRVLLEQRLNYSNWVPEGFGTGDVLILGNDRIHVLDLKYGAGVKVDAVDNSQMRLYALGAIQTFGAACSKVVTTVLQPRMDNFSSEELELADLLTWASTEVAPKAKLAWEGRGQFNPSTEACRFCKAKSVCNARAQREVKDALADFEVIAKKAPEAMTDDEVRKLLEKADSFVRWIDDAKEYLTKRAIGGDVPSGYELKQYSKARIWTDKNAVLTKLRDLAVPEDRIFSQPAMRSVSQLEASLGKAFFKVNFADLTEKQYGEPKLVKKELSDGGTEDFA